MEGVSAECYNGRDQSPDPDARRVRGQAMEIFRSVQGEFMAQERRKGDILDGPALDVGDILGIRSCWVTVYLWVLRLPPAAFAEHKL